MLSCYLLHITSSPYNISFPKALIQTHTQCCYCRTGKSQSLKAEISQLTEIPAATVACSSPPSVSLSIALFPLSQSQSLPPSLLQSLCVLPFSSPHTSHTLPHSLSSPLCLSSCPVHADRLSPAGLEMQWL